MSIKTVVFDLVSIDDIEEDVPFSLYEQNELDRIEYRTELRFAEERHPHLV